jgi:hypothetical protein
VAAYSIPAQRSRADALEVKYRQREIIFAAGG